MAVFYANGEVVQQSASRVDQEIYRYILQHLNGDFSDVLREDDRWEPLFHLSELRAALLGWYTFKEGAEVLEVGAGFGALTGYLCERTAGVTAVEASPFRAKALMKRYQKLENLTIYAGKVEELTFTHQFDYIVLIDILVRENTVSFLQQMKKLLKPDGKLLLVVDNRYGLRYLCGELNPHYDKSYSGFESDALYGFSRQEIMNALKAAGFSQNKFYYPLPDYRLPQVIYSDAHLPGKEMFERITPYYRSKETLLASELDLYEDILQNNVFPFLANSFFVECGDTDRCCAIDYAVVTADRGKMDSLVTSMRSDHKFVKKPMYREGICCMEKLHRNMQQLATRRIDVISYEFTDGVMIMPYIKEQTLANYLQSLKAGDKKHVFAVFDQLWTLILQSSVTVKDDLNVLLERAPKADWGPILQKAYLEMIPMNCFYRLNHYEFFDQEFIKANCPAKYPMFRAVLYCAGYLNHIVSLQELQQRYGLTALWDVLMREEDDFHFRLRRHDVYHQFYQWAWADKGEIQRNISFLNALRKVKALPEVLNRQTYDLYSFDIFDTLITRKTATPKGIFALLQDELRENPLYVDFPERIKENFYELRVYYEAQTFYEICKDSIGDITLDEIYDTFARREHLTEEQQNQLLLLERLKECENVLGIPENIAQVKKLKKQGKRVVLISNMYIDEKTLRWMLVQADTVLGELTVYVSSRYRKRKEDGTLYEMVQQYEKVDFLNWVHCGDNLEADVEVPKQLGIQAVWFQETSLSDAEKAYISGHEQEKDWQLRVGQLKNERVTLHRMSKEYTSVQQKEYGMANDFPCGILHERIAIYGAGRYGRDLYRRVQETQGKKVVLWVDKNYALLKKNGWAIKSPEALSGCVFDDVIIAVKEPVTVRVIQKKLLTMGIPREKIVDFV
jgi:FMN phosphatase YigB (HAD superfamily)/2-polyprenyl-3-methyl-5-hydroxy-6-metoxy-1,4-benzoquinol methylase